jgi:diguanylate cyclase (GGDEF)-like protein
MHACLPGTKLEARRHGHSYAVRTRADARADGVCDTGAMASADSPAALRLLCVGLDLESAQAVLEVSPFGPFNVEAVVTREEAALSLARQPADAIAVALTGGAALQAGDAMLSQWAADCAVVAVSADASLASSLHLLQLGVQDVLSPDEWTQSHLARRLRAAIERKRAVRELRKAHATDLMTGLPNRHQLVEHMAQWLALREREAASLGLLVVRIDGLAAIDAAHGSASADVVRRKVAVRLRAGVRASDVVASLGVDVFGVLLPSAESTQGAERVADKLRRALRQPFRVAGAPVGVSAHVGVAEFPRDGAHPDALLRHASSAALASAYGSSGSAND